VRDIRRKIRAACDRPLGTVPIYEAAAETDDPADLTPEMLLRTIEAQAREGVDFMTIHAGLLRAHLPAAQHRLLGIVSRGGALLAHWMNRRGLENPLYERFDDVLAICREHEVTLSLGDGLRPGCIADATDEAQLAELQALGGLVRRCRAAGVQAMVEGPGHVPLREIERNMRLEREWCDDAPFYVLGPLVTDCAPGYDHITGAIGGAWAAEHGAAMLCFVTPREHLGLPDADDTRRGLIAFRIAAHAADVAAGRPGARARDDAMSRARAAFDWEEQFRLALDPDEARRRFGGDLNTRGTDHCTMCGPKYCPMRLRRLENPPDGVTA
jgi:phosphomethylpyrimidine synthase